MKTLISVILFVLFSTSLFAQSSDTTIYANLSLNMERNKISLQCRSGIIDIIEDGKKTEQYIYVYKLTIDGKSIVDTLAWIEDCCSVEIIDINKTDNSKEILIIGLGMSDASCYRVYKNSNGPKLLCKADYCGSFEPDGKGNLFASHWMGFCSIKDKYVMSDDGEKIDMVNMDYYPVEMDYYLINPTSGDYETSKFAKVITSFELLSERSKTSSVNVKTKPGEKIYITGLDTKTITTKETVDNEEYEVIWIWIQMKTEEGKKGWILMKSWDQDFWSKIIEGVMFAS
jgi:hypothetical protein